MKTDREMMFEHFQSDLDFQKVVMSKLEGIESKLDENSPSYILKRYVPILEAWEGLSFTKKLTIGTGAVASAVAAVGAVIWWLVTYIRGH